MDTFYLIILYIFLNIFLSIIELKNSTIKLLESFY
jgi:hypothetical protein